MDSPVPYKLAVVAAWAFVILALGRDRQQGQEFKTILGLLESLRPAWDTRDLVSKTRKEKLDRALGGFISELKQPTCGRDSFQMFLLQQLENLLMYLGNNEAGPGTLSRTLYPVSVLQLC